MKNILILILMVIVLHVSAITTYQIGSDATYHQYSELPALSSGDIVNFKRGETFNGGFASIAGITIGAYGTGANPIISGFTTVTSWTNLGSNIWESTSAVSSLATCNMVSIGGVNTEMGRYPNTDNTPHSNAGWIPYNRRTISNRIVCPTLTGTPDWTGAGLVARTSQYIINRGTVTAQSIDTLTFDMSLWVPRSDVDGYCVIIQNHPATLDIQNEWYYNSSTHKIQVYSTSQPTNVKVASIEYLITLNGSNVSVNDIEFQGANTTAIYSNDLQPNKTVSGCSIRYCGLLGVYLKAMRATVENCEISDCNNGAIDFASSEWYGRISGNYIHDISAIESMGQGGGYCGIYLGGQSHAAIIENNRIINVGFNSMSVSGDSIVAKNNYVDTFNNVLMDGGGIYYNGTYTTAEGKDANIIENNIVLNGGTNGTAANGTRDVAIQYPIHAQGIYCDVVSVNYHIYGNTVANVENGILTAAIGNMDVQYNTIYNTTSAGIVFGGGLYGGNNNNFCKHNIIVQVNKKGHLGLASTSLTDDTPDMADFDYNVYSRPIYDYTPQTDFLNPFYSWANNVKYYRSTEEWIAYAAGFGDETHSTMSPVLVQSADSIIFAYNETNHDSIITLDYPSIDIRGNLHATTDTLSAMSSRIYLPYMNQEIPPDPTPDPTPDQTGQIYRWKNMYFRNHKN